MEMRSTFLSGGPSPFKSFLMNVTFCLNKMKQHTSSSHRPGVRGQVGFAGLGEAWEMVFIGDPTVALVDHT